MEKKICAICGNEFESEDLEETLCQECKAEVESGIEEDITVDEIDAQAEEAIEETSEETEADVSDAELADDEEELSDAEMSADVILSANGEEELTEEEILALEEEERLKQQKKEKTIKIASIIAGAVVLVLVVLFVPFKKDTVADKRVNLFTSIQSAITFSNDTEAAMSIGGERIDKSLFNYFFERAQYNLMMENLAADATEDDVKNFWSKEIDGRNAADVARENAKKDIIQFVVSRQEAAKAGVTMSSEESANLDQYMEAYITEDFLEQMKLTKDQVKYILEGSTLTSKLAEKLIAEDKKYDISNEDIEKSIKESGEKISAKHILFNTIDQTTYQPLSEEETANVKKKAEETLAKIKAGEDFDELMNELSEDPGLASYPDGYTFGKGEMVAPFEEAAFALEEGSVSDLVTTDFGIHIIKRIPLVLNESDIQNEKQVIQNEMFENDILGSAKHIKIMYNDALINSMPVASITE